MQSVSVSVSQCTVRIGTLDVRENGSEELRKPGRESTGDTSRAPADARKGWDDHVVGNVCMGFDDHVVKDDAALALSMIGGR
jgi:hypothetical protein